MNKVFLCGDTHGEYDINKLHSDNFKRKTGYSYEELDNSDILIILGDFGVIWNSTPDDLEKELLNFYDNLPLKVCFICGNHEQHDRLDHDYPEINFYGGRAHQISKNVYHLMRGYVFNFGGKKFFAFGGASSHDIQDGILDPEDPLFKIKYEKLSSDPFLMFRVKGVSWWERELPSAEEMIRGIDNLEKVNYEVDYVITHSLPTNILFSIFPIDYEADKLTDYFQDLIDSGLDFKKWYSGHYHMDMDVFNQYVLMFNSIQRIV